LQGRGKNEQTHDRQKVNQFHAMPIGLNVSAAYTHPAMKGNSNFVIVRMWVQPRFAGYSLTAGAVISEMLSSFAKATTRSELEAFFTGFTSPGMVELEVRSVGWIVDDHPSPFIWQSSYPSEVFYNDFYFEGSGERYYESVLQSGLLSGRSPGRSGSIDISVAAAHSALSHCGLAFFSDQLDYGTSDKNVRIAYEVLVDGYGRFWPLGPTMYLPWTYHWDSTTQTGTAELAPRLRKMNFLGHHSVVQAADHDDLRY
jgi:hypothetical protein